MNMTLVAFFSATGNTASVARSIAALTKADIFDIMPKDIYTAADLDWNNAASRSSLEMKDAACRPAIADAVQGMQNYKTVFLGFPVWWYEVPRIVLTFLESYDFSGKAMIPFVTSGSSGLGNIPAILKKACPAAHWEAGKRFPQHPAPKDVEEWVAEHHGWMRRG